MIEEIKIGKTSCHYLSPQQFSEYCQKTLKGDDLKHIVTLNPEMIIQAENNQVFSNNLNKANLRVSDGAGIIWARWFLRSKFWNLWPSLLAFPFIQVERITGVEAVTTLAQSANKLGLSVYLLGGTPQQNLGAKNILQEQFPQLKINTGLDNQQQDIASKRPAILLVAYGSPKQTNWIEENRQLLEKAGTKIAIGVGGAFAILSEVNPRAPKFFRKLNIEWLWRLILEPSRLNRIIDATIKFPLLVNKQKSGEKPPLT